MRRSTSMRHYCEAIRHSRESGNTALQEKAPIILQRLFACLLSSLLLTVPTTSYCKDTVKTNEKNDYPVITWEDLIPKGWDPLKDFKQMNLGAIPDGDPRALEMLDKLRKAWDEAPVEPSMVGKLIKIPGYVVPLDKQGELTETLLLVPYFGACIHTPPPPANQIISAKLPKPQKLKTMDTVWLMGKLTVQRQDTMMGKAGYFLRVDRLENYVIPPASNTGASSPAPNATKSSSTP